MPSPSPSAPRLHSLTGARFVAAVGVFLFHAVGVYPAEGPFGSVLAFVGSNGAIGVDFFFALSGFVLAWSWRPGGSARAFYRRRFARIAPAYWVALVYGLLWVIVLYRDPLTATLRALPSVFGIQAWFPDPAVHFAANGVEWSVSAELFFYALFPILIRIAYRRGGRTALSCVAIALGFIAPYAMQWTISGNLAAWALGTLPALRIGGFLCGLLLAVAMREGWRIPLRPWQAVALFLALYVLRPMTPGWVPHRALDLISILTVIAALAQRDLVGGRGALTSRLMVRLGDWSYCFYLVHQMTLQIMLFVCARVVHGPALGPVWIVSALAACVGVAALLYVVVERPFERRIGRSRRSPSALARHGVGVQEDLSLRTARAPYVRGSF